MIVTRERILPAAVEAAPSTRVMVQHQEHSFHRIDAGCGKRINPLGEGTLHRYKVFFSSLQLGWSWKQRNVVGRAG